ncbi:fumarylacetoacetate hydrolase family protein [Acrocarpospora macrocephala]|uniref:Hydrolase n=1 Tax=Acrocarpospora macrocephala TaxID=150177 RepID=A0A5M3WJQ0_9ACTN|nr:hydrolase [Acrocarpospora macrocephala]
MKAAFPAGPDLTDNVSDHGFGLAAVRLPSGQRRLRVVSARGVYPVSLALGARWSDVTTVNQLLPDWDTHVRTISSWLQSASPDADGSDGEAAEVLAPVCPGHIYQAAANYRRHVIDLMVASPRPEHRDLGLADRRAVAVKLMDERVASGVPTVFSGAVSSLCGPYDDVVIPHITEQCDWELELAAVIKAPARYVSKEDALDYVAGYTIANDITMRDQIYPSGDSSRGADWLASKSAPTHLPVGPLLVPAAFVAPGDVTITLRLNGQVMQDESSADMIYDLPRLIEHTSRYALMRPGDLLLTGSPAGNGVHHGRFLRAGDVMEGRISGLGVQRTGVVDEPS